ncbi:heparan-alpha-glucosaminide N-acetyltransferase isoform X4 [Ricinus communis]|uniref:heparan-alpha-glucosaminide N-acetyltransferase isoform X4 n=1 Tax=Ricinus communis TaxID=3988 RepID=UPI00077281CF|nr:heparan-alpha-glucosaminide N-acetyltransferase isoform X4 [Ricinus communis]|eukprot:XP_015572454.1 heparan-alpha-glucosaminide N-acetyltransferase isoform X4 [Ricinus communis]
MSALITVAEDEQRQSLLHHYNDEDEKEEEIAPSSSSSDEREALPPPTPNQRLMSLDVFRGLTIALMILVDDAGGAFPSINHSPWFGVTLADFVMPFFLFGVGVSISLVFKKISSKSVATKKVMLRTIKLFLLGVLLQGGYFHGRNHLTYGIDVLKIRWLGVLQVICGVRGSLEPPCNAVGLIDRFLLGEHHLYQRPVYRRTKQCSVNSPDYGPLPPNSPPWCLAPFDPEGILSSLMAAVTCLLGLQFGHVLVHLKDHMQRILVWLISSFSLLVTGFVLKLIGIPFSKPLYTLSYTCITTGASGLLLTIIFYAVDVKHFRKAIAILQWMGMNALIIYALAACDLFPAALQGFYWQSPENNLVLETDRDEIFYDSSHSLELEKTRGGESKRKKKVLSLLIVLTRKKKRR